MVDTESSQHYATQKSLDQPTIPIDLHFKIIIARPGLTKVSESKPINPGRHEEVLKIQPIGETVPLFSRRSRRLDQFAVVINFFSTDYESRICLLVNGASTESTPKTAIFPALTIFGETIQLQITSGTTQ